MPAPSSGVFRIGGDKVLEMSFRKHLLVLHMEQSLSCHSWEFSDVLP